MNFVRVLHAETLKMRRTIAFRMAVLAPGIVVLLAFLAAWQAPFSTITGPGRGRPWDALTLLCMRLWAALMLPLAFDPGGRWEYGINIDWIGKAVERVSGQKLGEYFAEHLFGPIGMKDTGFKLTPERRARLAGMHTRGPDGTLAPMEFELPQEPEFEMGGGGLYGTAADYLAFTTVFLNEGRVNGGGAGASQVLQPDTIRLMVENAMGELNVRPLPAAPPYSNEAEFFPGMVKKWGLGFMISTGQVPGGRSPSSLAWAGLGNTYFWIDPTKGVAGVILMQLLPFADPKALALLESFERAVYAALA